MEHQIRFTQMSSCGTIQTSTRQTVTRLRPGTTTSPHSQQQQNRQQRKPALISSPCRIPPSSGGNISVQYLASVVYVMSIYLFILPNLISTLLSLEQQQQFTILSYADAQKIGADSTPMSSNPQINGDGSIDDDDNADFDEFAEFDSMDPDHHNLANSKIDNNINKASTKGDSVKAKKKSATNPATDKEEPTTQSSKADTTESNAQTKKIANQQQSVDHEPASDKSQQASTLNEDSKKTQDTSKNSNKGQQAKSIHKEDIHDDDNDDDFDYVEDKTKPKEDIKVVNAPMPIKYTWDTYYVEIFFITVISLYFVNFFIGSGKNEQIACQWYEANRSLLKQNFALVGGPPQLPLSAGDDKNKEDSSDSPRPKQQQQRGLIKETESSYVLWCSGRVGMEGMLTEINLLKRQDLLSMFMDLLKPSRDNFVLRMQLNQDSIDNFVFCLAQKSTSARLAKEMIDVNTFCPERKPASRYGVNSEKLYLMSEIKEVSTFLFDTKTSQLISAYEDCIDYIHITDQYSLIKHQEDIPVAQKLSSVRRMATFSFNFPRPANNTRKDDSGNVDDNNRLNIETMVLLAFTIIDKLRRFRLSRDGKQKSEKNRQKITDILQKAAFVQRQEAAQAKKEELRRQEKERIYEEDDPTKQRKWEKKEAKRELKKSRKMKQLKVKSKG